MQHKSKIVLAKGVRVVGSLFHFTAQTSSDLILKAEVITLKKLDVYDLTKNELKQARQERTELTQYKIKDSLSQILHPKNFESKKV